MTAIATKIQRIENAKNFISTFSDSPIQDHLYLFLAKSDYWSTNRDATADNIVETPTGETYDISQIHNEMIAMKKVEPNNFVCAVPTINWISGETYTAWDDKFSETVEVDGVDVYNTIYDKNFYVITTSYKVYKCLRSGSGISFDQPSHVGVEPLQYSDGYVWHYIYTLDAASVLTFFNNSYCPIVEKTSQDANQENIAGGIFKIVVEDGGSGYLTAPTITIEGNGTGAVATATLSGNSVSEITIDLTDSIVEGGKYGLKHGTGYDYAKVIISSASGSGARARAILSPPNGHGYDPISELGAYNVEIAIDINDDEDGDFIITNDYRKLGLIKNPNEGSPETLATSTTLNCLKSMVVSGGTFVPDDIIEDQTTNAFAYVDAYDSGTNTIYYHQNDKTGYKTFGVGNIITTTVSGESGTITTLIDPEYSPFSGEIIFMEFRSAIERTSTTKEEIRIVLQF
jgi:hypothetical protein